MKKILSIAGVLVLLQGCARPPAPVTSINSAEPPVDLQTDIRRTKAMNAEHLRKSAFTRHGSAANAYRTDQMENKK